MGGMDCAGNYICLSLTLILNSEFNCILVYNLDFDTIIVHDFRFVNGIL